MTTLDSVDRRLLERYGTEAFMYVEYPHKRFWRKQESDTAFKESLARLFEEDPSVPLMLYVHIPFCHKQCLFCTCHVEIELQYQVVKRYLEYLGREIEMMAAFFKERGITSNVREIHLGGGSPTYPKAPEFDVLVDQLSTIADIGALDEFAIEIDPCRSSRAVWNTTDPRASTGSRSACRTSIRQCRRRWTGCSPPTLRNVC